MGKRTPEQFLAEEGMTIDTARRIYSNFLDFIEDYQHIGCVSEISTTNLIHKIFTNGTDNDSGTSIRQFLKDIGEDRNIIEYDLTDSVYCNSIECCMREECRLYQNTIKEEEEENNG